MDSEQRQPPPPREQEWETSVSEHYAALTDRMVNFGGDLLACHFGLWGPDTANDREALLRANHTLVQGCDLGPGRRVLDAGCGVGGTAIALAEAYGVHVTGLTICEPHIAVATEHAQQRGVGHLVEFLYGDFMYRDFDRFASDFERIVDEGRFDHLRVETRIHDREILVNAGTEYDGDLDERAVLDGLGHDEIATVRDNADVGRATMFPSWGFIRGNYHPWRDWFVPWEALRTLLAQPWLNEAWVPRAPWSWVGMYPIGTGSADAPFVMHPKGERMLLYSILAVLGKYEKAWELSRRLEEIDRTLVGLGGKGYLSGRVGYGRREWEDHYAETLETGIRWKREFDPKRVFAGEGMPFEEGSVALDQGRGTGIPERRDA